MKFTGKRISWVTFEIPGIQKSATFKPGFLKKKCTEEAKHIMSKYIWKIYNLKVQGFFLCPVGIRLDKWGHINYN